MTGLAEVFQRVLTDHVLGFMGTCVTEKGAPGCPWKPRRDVVRHGGFGSQHRQHQAELLVAAARPAVPAHRPVPPTEQEALVPASPRGATR